MNMMIMQANEVNYRMEAEERLVEKMISSFRKYWEENSDIILKGLDAFSKNFSLGYIYSK